jgi:hypothetical protein
MKEKKTKPPTYREKRKEDSVKNFLGGEARQPYILREDIVGGLKNRVTQINEKNENKNRKNDNSCICQETLGQFSGMFKNMIHTDQDSIKKSSSQKGTTEKHWDIKRQNKWLLENVFDSYGNYIYCFSCVKEILGIGGTRLHRLREIKRQQINTPVIQIRKDQVLIKQICDVVSPVSEPNILTWWMSLENSTIVELRIFPKLHSGKSNYDKEELLSYFLDFIDNNSQANGRRVGSHGALYFLNSKFDRINEPSVSEIDKPEQWKKRSLVYEFNRSLDGNKKISNGTAKKWLKKYRPKHAISPRKTDYCEMCVECQEQKKRCETISMRLQLHCNSNEAEIHENKALAESYGILLEEHKMDAGNELQHYREQIKKSREIYQHIEKLQKKRTKVEQDKIKLKKLSSQIVFTGSIDYQQAMLIPHWGVSNQPSETYYLRKSSNNIFGVVDHTLEKNAIYVLEERVCNTKNGDTTISFIDHYIQKLPSWARHICLFMDNGAINKNQFLIQWGMELVERHDYETIRMCFFVPGHAKSEGESLFSCISHAFDNNDVFNIEHLVTLIKNTIEPIGACFHVRSNELVNWKNLLEKKYVALKEIKRYRDFLIKRNPHGNVVVYCKECCYQGEYSYQELKKDDKHLDLRKEIKNFTYKARGMSKELSQEKLSDLVKMYDKFIDPALRPKWLPASQVIEIPQVTTTSKSSELARQHRAALKKERKENLKQRK